MGEDKTDVFINVDDSKEASKIAVNHLTGQIPINTNEESDIDSSSNIVEEDMITPVEETGNVKQERISVEGIRILKDSSKCNIDEGTSLTYEPENEENTF